MKSTGNDIVALATIDIQRTNLPAFYSKFITTAEQALYQQPLTAAVPFQSFVWLLWSIKESVYKYLQRADTGLIFSPSKIIIKSIDVPFTGQDDGLTKELWESDHANEDFYTGQVLSEEYQLYFRSKINTAFIATVVSNSPGFKNVYWGIKKINDSNQENQSGEARQFLLKKLRSILGVEHLHIEKSPAGYPLILQDSKISDSPVSLAHHGHYVAFSFCL